MTITRYQRVLYRRTAVSSKTFLVPIRLYYKYYIIIIIIIMIRVHGWKTVHELYGKIINCTDANPLATVAANGRR